MKKIIIIIVILIIIGAGGFFGFKAFTNNQAQKTTQYQTEELQRDTLSAIVGATGTVRPNQTTQLAWQTSGTIKRIHVETGETVKGDEILAELSKDSLPQNIILAEADLIDAQRALDNLFDSETTRSKAYQAYVAAQDELEDAREDRQSLDYQRASDNIIDEAWANYILAEDAVKIAEDDFNNVAHFPEDDLTRAMALSKLATERKKRDQALANLNWLMSKPDELEVSEAEAREKVALADYEDALREWERLKDGPDPDDIKAAQARITALEATINNAQLEAPFTGTVTKVNSKTGDQVSAGTISFRIDDLSKLLVDVDITEIDINDISIGQLATLSFDAIQTMEYQGVVTEVGKVGDNVQGVINFLVTVEIIDADENILPGMTAAVNIIVDEKENVLLVPNRAVRFDEGKRIVYILNEEGLQTPVEIKIGATSDFYSEVISGDVEEGDQIILNPIIMPNFGPPG